VFTVRTATGQQRTVHPTNHREALHLMHETETKTELGTKPDACEQDPDAA
jgi:hypothetical protein